MLDLMQKFGADEDGAVTVDWVILTAGVVGVALAATGAVVSGTEQISADVDGALKSQLIKTSFESSTDVEDVN